MTDDFLPPADLPDLPDWFTESGMPDLPTPPDDFLSLPVAVGTLEPPSTASVPHDPLPAVTPPPRSFGPALAASPVQAESDTRTLHLPAQIQPQTSNEKVGIRATVAPPPGESWADVRVLLRSPKGVRSAEVSHKPKVSRGRIEWALGDLGFGAAVKLFVRLPNIPAVAAFMENPPPFEVTYVPVAKPELTVTLSGPTRVRTGATFTVGVAVENQGRGPAADVSLAITRGDRPTEQTVHTVGDLTPGEQATAGLQWTSPETEGPATWHVRAVTGSITSTHTFTADVTTPVAVEAFGPSMLDLDVVERFGATVTNPSSQARRHMTVSLSVPPQLQYDSSDGLFRIDSGRIDWTFTDLEPGESRTVSAWLRGHLPGSLTVSATATGEGETVSATAASVCELPRQARNTSLATALAELDRGVSDDFEERATPAAATGERHILFRMGISTYACPLVQLREVIRTPTITPVPDAPEWLLGLANVRGDVTSIVDLPLALGLESEGRGARPVLMAETSDKQTAVGLLVDEVVGIRRMSVSPWTPDDGMEWGRVGEFLSGLSEQNEQLIPVIDLDQVLTSDLLEVFEPA
jgi:purine-binding chemotaxis protein CheW